MGVIWGSVIFSYMYGHFKIFLKDLLIKLYIDWPLHFEFLTKALAPERRLQLALLQTFFVVTYAQTSCRHSVRFRQCPKSVIRKKVQ